MKSIYGTLRPTVHSLLTIKGGRSLRLITLYSKKSNVTADINELFCDRKSFLANIKKTTIQK